MHASKKAAPADPAGHILVEAFARATRFHCAAFWKRVLVDARSTLLTFSDRQTSYLSPHRTPSLPYLFSTHRTRPHTHRPHTSRPASTADARGRRAPDAAAAPGRRRRRAPAAARGRSTPDGTSARRRSCPHVRLLHRRPLPRDLAPSSDAAAVAPTCRHDLLPDNSSAWLWLRLQMQEQLSCSTLYRFCHTHSSRGTTKLVWT